MRCIVVSKAFCAAVVASGWLAARCGAAAFGLGFGFFFAAFTTICGKDVWLAAAAAGVLLGMTRARMAVTFAVAQPALVDPAASAAVARRLRTMLPQPIATAITESAASRRNIRCRNFCRLIDRDTDVQAHFRMIMKILDISYACTARSMGPQ